VPAAALPIASQVWNAYLGDRIANPMLRWLKLITLTVIGTLALYAAYYPFSPRGRQVACMRLASAHLQRCSLCYRGMNGSPMSSSMNPPRREEAYAFEAIFSTATWPR